MTHTKFLTKRNRSTALFLAVTAALAGTAFTSYAAEEGPINNFFGDGAGDNNTGSQASFFGGSAGNNNSGFGNSFFGYLAGESNTSAFDNSFFGAQAGRSTTTGWGNAFFGGFAGTFNTTGDQNAFFGDQAGIFNTTGTQNVFVGKAAGFDNTTGGSNVFLGRGAGSLSDIGSRNTYLGSFVTGLPDLTNAAAIGYRSFVSRDNSLVLGSIPGVNEDFEPNPYVNVGIGTDTPNTALHVKREDTGLAKIRVEHTGSSSVIGSLSAMIELIRNGHPRILFRDTSQSGVSWVSGTTGTQGSDEAFMIRKPPKFVGQPAQMLLRPNGDLEISGTLFQGSSRTIKERITEMTGETVLNKLDAMPVHEWSYQASPETRHVGPMAEDFYSTFGLGHSDKHVAPGDLAGVALAAAKAVNERSARLEAENAELRERLARVEAMLMDDS